MPHPLSTPAFAPFFGQAEGAGETMNQTFLRRRTATYP